MARGGRGGRRQPQQRGAPSGRAGRIARKRAQRGATAPLAQDLPTAAPGAADAPAGASSLVGGGAVHVTPGAARRREIARRRNRGGPRAESERMAAGLRARALNYDFRYVGSDLRWIFYTTAGSVGLVVALWAIIRL